MKNLGWRILGCQRRGNFVIVVRSTEECGRRKITIGICFVEMNENVEMENVRTWEGGVIGCT